MGRTVGGASTITKGGRTAGRCTGIDGVADDEDVAPDVLVDEVENVAVIDKVDVGTAVGVVDVVVDEAADDDELPLSERYA